MNSRRYEILSLASSGQIAPEEADRLLVALGSKHRMAIKTLWIAAVVVLVPALILGFHQGEHVRLILAQCMQEIDSVEVFRQVHVSISRAIQAL